MLRKDRRLTLGISLLILVLMLGVAMWTNRLIYNNVVKQCGEKGLSIVRAMSELIDVELILDIIEKQDQRNPDYLNMLELFERVCEENDALYLYTVHYDQNGVLRYGIVADGEDDTLGLIVAEEDITKEALQSLNEGVQTYEYPYTYEQWGALMTSNTPIRDGQGNIVGILGVDFSEEDIVSRTKAILKQATMIIIIVGFLASLLTWCLFNKVLKSSLKQTENMQQLL